MSIDIKQVVPLDQGTRRASTSWRSNLYGPNDFTTDSNIACKCGEPSGWRVDVDLAHSFAIEAARPLLPQTGPVHGRPGKPDSHYWYHCVGAVPATFKDIKSGAGMLVEVRSTGGYTMLPYSAHPSEHEHTKGHRDHR